MKVVPLNGMETKRHTVLEYFKEHFVFDAILCGSGRPAILPVCSVCLCLAYVCIMHECSVYVGCV